VNVLLNAGANIDAEDEYGLSPLSQAARNGHVEVVNVLLNTGANIQRDDKDGLSPLKLRK
jgi:ankyrin repeat protein